VCEACGVEAFVRRGKYKCPIGWHEQHGQKFVGPQGIDGPRYRRRKEHRLFARMGIVDCSCGERVRPLPNGDWACSTQYDQAIRGIRRQEEIWGTEMIEEARELGADLDPIEMLTDADLEMAATVKTREYTTLDGRRLKGG
jgi:hypothetical protein